MHPDRPSQWAPAEADSCLLNQEMIFPHTSGVLPQDSTRFPVEGVWEKIFILALVQEKQKKVLIVKKSDTYIRVRKKTIHISLFG